MDPCETAEIQLKIDTQAGCGKRCVPNITFFFFSHAFHVGIYRIHVAF